MSDVGTDSYTLKMIDMITEPLKRIEAQMGRTADLMEKMGGGSSGGLLGGISKGMLGVGAAVGVAYMGLKGLFSLMEMGIGIAGRLTFAFGAAIIEATKFRTQNITALDVVLGKGRGEGVFNKALDIGGITPANEMDVVKQVRELATAGYRGGGLSKANAALLDVQAIQGQEQADGLRYYFRKFFGGRKVEADDLRMASMNAGLQENEVMRRLLTNAGVKPKDDNAAMGSQFDAMKKNGKFTGQAVVMAIMQGINEHLDEGKGLGSAAQKMGMGTLTGLLSNLEAAPMRFLNQLQLEKMPGIQSLMEFLKRILVFFDKGSAEGKRLTLVVEEMVNTLFGGLDKIDSQDLGAFFQAGLDAAEGLTSAMKLAWNYVDAILHGNWEDVLMYAGATLAQIGEIIGSGMYKGFKSAFLGQDDKLSTLDARRVNEAHRKREIRGQVEIDQEIDRVLNGGNGDAVSDYIKKANRGDYTKKIVSVPDQKIEVGDYLERHNGKGIDGKKLGKDLHAEIVDGFKQARKEHEGVDSEYSNLIKSMNRQIDSIGARK